MTGVIEQLLASRGLTELALRQAFFSPDYEQSKHDPFLLPDMSKAVDRLLKAKQKGELVYIYGDYDIDGLTATTLLLEAFEAFGIKAKAFIPNRFTDGYGLSKAAMRLLAERKAKLVVTVDCGSLSHGEIELANQLGMDVIVTDHHTVADTMPSAVATINPKRTDHKYPFIDLAGVGVAFKLVQALQQKTDGLPLGQEKWLLDLVALGTVCDVVQLLDENRTNVFWGLRVMSKTRRHGIKALAHVAGLELDKVNARSLGFVLGPHLNAAGRIETAQLSLDLLVATDPLKAVEVAYKLRELNLARRSDQQSIAKQAMEQAEQFAADKVLVLSHPDWSHGIIGIVAAKVQESLYKPTFVLQELGEQSKGSARSFGDFSAVDAIRSADPLIIKGGGHKFAAGVTLKTTNIPAFRKALNDFYLKQNLQGQSSYFEPKADVTVGDLGELTDEVVQVVRQLEPYGHGNPEPVFYLPRAIISRRQLLGKDSTHLKLDATDSNGKLWQFIGFGMAEKYKFNVGDEVCMWFKLIENEWRGVRRLEGQIVKISDYV